jgi:hypothetical protein
MKAIKLYKFINNNGIEIHWRGENKDKLLIWVQYYNFNDFKELIKDYLEYLGQDSAGLEVTMRSNDIVIDIVDLCEYYEIDPFDILDKNEDD